MMSASNDGTIRLWGFQLLEGYLVSPRQTAIYVMCPMDHDIRDTGLLVQRRATFLDSASISRCEEYFCDRRVLEYRLLKCLRVTKE